jgi:hypothetical protein
LKFEYLNGVENAGNFKSNVFSGDFGRGSAPPPPICNSYGLGWRKSPLVREGGRGEEEGGGGGEKERMKHFTRPPHGIYGMVLPSRVSDICPEYPDVRNVRLPLNQRRISMKDRIEFRCEKSSDVRGSLNLRLANNQQMGTIDSSKQENIQIILKITLLAILVGFSKEISL